MWSGDASTLASGPRNRQPIATRRRIGAPARKKKRWNVTADPAFFAPFANPRRRRAYGRVGLFQALAKRSGSGMRRLAPTLHADGARSESRRQELLIFAAKCPMPKLMASVTS